MSDTKPAWLREAEQTWDPALLFGRLRGITYRRENVTDNYVVVPPALMITDHDGAVWSFGNEYRETRWFFEMEVLRNDVKTGHFAERIEFKAGTVVLYGKDGRRVVSRSRKHIL